MSPPPEPAQGRDPPARRTSGPRPRRTAEQRGAVAPRRGSARAVRRALEARSQPAPSGRAFLLGRTWRTAALAALASGLQLRLFGRPHRLALPAAHGVRGPVRPRGVRGPARGPRAPCWPGAARAALPDFHPLCSLWIFFNVKTYSLKINRKMHCGKRK